MCLEELCHHFAIKCSGPSLKSHHLCGAKVPTKMCLWWRIFQNEKASRTSIHTLNRANRSYWWVASSESGLFRRVHCSRDTVMRGHFLRTLSYLPHVKEPAMKGRHVGTLSLGNKGVLWRQVLLYRAQIYNGRLWWMFRSSMVHTKCAAYLITSKITD